jgi:MOSC domain-containing protein YiiM
MKKVISVNVGTPKEIAKKGSRKIFSAIFKMPIHGPVTVRRLNLDGDRQADLTVHGGADKAVYVYPSEHYTYWKEKFPDMKLDWGSFGENLTTEGFLESEVHLGDQFDIGTAQFEVSQPRLPCFKLGIRFADDAMVKLFLDSERTGFYLRVLKEGEIEAGDEIKRVHNNRHAETITSIVQTVKESEAD